MIVSLYCRYATFFYHTKKNLCNDNITISLSFKHNRKQVIETENRFQPISEMYTSEYTISDRMKNLLFSVPIARVFSIVPQALSLLTITE